MSYLFYDLETSGLNKAFDQVFQFGAIRTDLRFQEIERYQIQIALSKTVLPAPGALITHQIPFEDLLQGVSEYQGIKTIHHLLTQPKTCSLGYNTLGFDDEFLRFSFYRHLLPPYHHQYLNQCSRMDLYPMLIFYYLYQSDILRWPKKPDGKVSLKLDALNAENHWHEGAAHQAIVDVEITLHLAKLLKTRKATWDYLCGFFHKATDQKRLETLPAAFETVRGVHPFGLYIDGSLGAEKHFQTQVLGLGFHTVYRNQTLWLNLDDIALPEKMASGRFDQMWVFRKKLAEPGFLLQPKARFIKSSHAQQKIIDANLAYLAANGTQLVDAIDVLCYETYPEIPKLDPQAALYQAGFPSAEDEALCGAFHHSTQAQRLDIVSRLRSPILRMLALRLLAQLQPELLTEAERLSVAAFRQARFDSSHEPLIDYRGQAAPQRSGVLAEIEKQLTTQNLTVQQQQILRDYQAYLQIV